MDKGKIISRPGRKGDCGRQPRVGKPGDPKPSRTGRGPGRGRNR